MNRVEEGTRIAREVGSPNVSVMADFFHMNIEEADLHATLRLLREGRLIPVPPTDRQTTAGRARLRPSHPPARHPCAPQPAQCLRLGPVCPSVNGRSYEVASTEMVYDLPGSGRVVK